MKNARKIYDIGQVILVIGSLMYLVELMSKGALVLTLPITCVYAVALVLMLIGWIGTKDERKAAKAAKKAAKKAA